MGKRRISAILCVAARWVAAIIMLQTLYFKFTGAPESMLIFGELGKYTGMAWMEPYGRLLTGVMELIAGALILIPRTTPWGAILGIGLMSGAILAHLVTPLGIEINMDGGLLFEYAILTLLCCLYVLYVQREVVLSQIRHWGTKTKR